MFKNTLPPLCATVFAEKSKSKPTVKAPVNLTMLLPPVPPTTVKTVVPVALRIVSSSINIELF